MELSLEKIRETLDQMPANGVAYSLKDDVLRCLYYTAGFPAVMGYTKAELKKQRDVYTWVFEEDRPTVREKARRFLSMDQYSKTEFLFRLVHKTHSFVWVHMTAQKLGLLDGGVVITGSIVDVTKEMENSNSMMEATTRGICVIEKASKRLLYANSRFYEMVDSSPEQAKGKYCYEILCKSMQMKTNNNCPCFACINKPEPVESYNPIKGTYLSMTGTEMLWGEYESYVFFLSDVTREHIKDEQLEDSIKRFNVALDNSDLMIWEYDMVNHRCINSEKAGRDYDIPLVIENYPESLFITGYTPPETIVQIKDVKRRLFNGETGFSVERRTIDKYGNSQWQKVGYTLECDDNGRPLRAIVCGQDITARKKLEKRYEEQVEYRNSLAEKAMFSIRLDMDADLICDYTSGEALFTEIVKKSDSATAFFSGFFEHAVFNPNSVINRETLELTTLKNRYIQGQSHYQTMYQCSLLNKYLEMSLTLYKNPGTGHLEAFIIVLDVSNNAFLHDPLTGLFNRQKSFLECARVMREHPDEPLVMAHFDIRDFRLYNSFFGEEEGDNLLKYIADILRTLEQTHDYGAFGRIEADVFLLLFPYREHIVEWNCKFIQDKLLEYRSDFQITAKWGVYLMKDRALPAEAAFNRAALAAKTDANTMNSLSYFDAKMEQHLRDEQYILKEMTRAIEEEQFKVYLQPKYVLLTGEALGAEALVRWIHPEKGMIMPDTFIRLFEENGFITTLDQYMWEHVCRLLREWMDAGYTPAPVSVNVSRVSMYSPKTVPFLVKLVKKYAIPPELLNLELTESAYMDDPDAMKHRLEALRGHGFKIMMDDFGSGYSSLNTLRDIPVDYLKVDRMFLASVDKDKRSRLVLEAVVHMATKMGIPVITEGVERDAQKEFLTSIGCDYAQGYLYSKPIPAEEYTKKYVQLPAGERVRRAVPDEPARPEELDLNTDTEVVRFANALPFAVAFVEYVGDSFAYLSANRCFLQTFGMHNDVADKDEVVRKHLQPEHYEALRAAYQKTAETQQEAGCTLCWNGEDGQKQCYLVKAKYLDKGAYSTVMTVAFVPLDK